MSLHMRGEESFLDKLFLTMKAFKFPFRCVGAYMVVALIFVLEENAADVTSELFNVSVL